MIKYIFNHIHMLLLNPLLWYEYDVVLNKIYPVYLIQYSILKGVSIFKLFISLQN